MLVSDSTERNRYEPHGISIPFCSPYVLDMIPSNDFGLLGFSFEKLVYQICLVVCMKHLKRLIIFEKNAYHVINA